MHENILTLFDLSPARPGCRHLAPLPLRKKEGRTRLPPLYETRWTPPYGVRHFRRRASRATMAPPPSVRQGNLVPFFLHLRGYPFPSPRRQGLCAARAPSAYVACPWQTVIKFSPIFSSQFFFRFILGDNPSSQYPRFCWASSRGRGKVRRFFIFFPLEIHDECTLFLMT